MTISSTFLFLLLAIYRNSLLCNAVAAPSPAPAPSPAHAPSPVRDSAGRLVRAGVNYYILQRNRGPVFGLTLAATRNKTCPLDVVRVPYQPIPSNNNGLPLTFTPVNRKKGVIRTSTDMNIKFDAVITCVQSTVWKLDNFDESTGNRFITTGGVVGNPGIGTINNWFKIEEVDYDYKLVYCPSVCKTCKVRCSDIGLISDGDHQRLGLSNFPLRIFFQKA